MAEFSYEILEHIAVLGEAGDLSTELNVIRYGGQEPKYDLRRWRNVRGEKRMQKGVTLSADELWMLRQILNERDSF